MIVLEFVGVPASEVRRYSTVLGDYDEIVYVTSIHDYGSSIGFRDINFAAAFTRGRDELVPVLRPASRSCPTQYDR